MIRAPPRTTTSTVYWLSAICLLVAIVNLSVQRHGLVSAVSEFQAAPEMLSDPNNNNNNNNQMYYTTSCSYGFLFLCVVLWKHRGKVRKTMTTRTNKKNNTSR